MEGSNQKITGYIKIIEPTVNNLMSDVDRKVLRISRRRDEIVLDLTLRDKKQHYYYDDYNSKFFMPEPCFNDRCRDIERLCGQDLCEPELGVVTNINPPLIDPPIRARTFGKTEAGTTEGDEGIVFITPGCPPNQDFNIVSGKCEPVGCPPGYEVFGRAEDNCRGQCCICGDVAHCMYITSFKSGYVVRQCAPAEAVAEIRELEGCANFGADCTCPKCGECEGSSEPGGPCYCIDQLPRQSPSVEFEICDVKTVIACWKPGDGLVDGTMKFISQDGTEAFLDFENNVWKPGYLGEDLRHVQSIELEDPDVPGAYDDCPQTTCLLACGYGDTQEGFICEPREDLVPEVVREGCSTGQSVYYQYNCYGVLTCPQGSHYSECRKVPRLVFSWHPIEVAPINCDGSSTPDGASIPFGNNGNGYPGSIAGDCGWDAVPQGVNGDATIGGPRHSAAEGCNAREASEDCGELDADGSLPEEYQENWGGTLYPQSSG